MKRVLVVESGEDSASWLDQRFREAGALCTRVGDAEAGWRAFTTGSPPDAVFTALTTPKRDGAWLLRRMQEDYLGTLPPIYALVSADELGTRLPNDFDAALLRPVSIESMLAMSSLTAADEEPAATATRLRDLFETSLLAGDLDAAIKAFVDRVARGFRVYDCAVVFAPEDPLRPWERRLWAHRPSYHDGSVQLLLGRCDLALAAGTTLIASDGVDAGGTLSLGRVPWSYLAAPLEAPGGGFVGTLCLSADGPRRFHTEERYALRALARRAGLELAWRSAHERLTAEHDRLRQSALLDPLCGVLTRQALEDTIAAEMARAAEGDEAIMVAIIDVVQLRQVNERYGHIAGDAALAQLADLIRSSVRPQDLVGRVGGDELGVVMPAIPQTNARELLERMAHAVAENPFYHLGAPIELRVRIGATAAGAGGSPAEVLARAATALHLAKRTGASFHMHVPGETAKPLVSITGGHEIVDPDTIDTSDSLGAGTTLAGMYQILHEISRGAMGVVYRAEDLGLRRPVAVKVLRPELARDEALVARFRDEASLLASVRHEHLVQVYTFGAQGEDVFFVMELVEGESLAELLSRLDTAGEPVPLDLVEAVVVQVAGALDVLHKAGAVHRDVKPANILLDRARDRAVLVDVGVARGAEPNKDEAAGTPGFAAPESFMLGDEGPGTDVYGLAATAYMLITNIAPFGGGDVNKVVKRQLGDTPAAPSMLRPELSEAVDRAIRRGLAPDLKSRFGNALEFARELSAALQASRGLPKPLAGTLTAHSSVRAAMTQTGSDAHDAITYDGTTSEPEGLAAFDPGSTRGAIFRVAYRILGNRLGSAWLQAACEARPALRAVLSPSVGALSWYPVARLGELLGSVPASVRDPHKVARELGRAAMTQIFARFFGTDPGALTPAQVLGEARRFWSRFHTWGHVNVQAEPGRALVHIGSTPRDPLVCCLVEGSLERIAELAGGMHARATHTACESQGAASCAFEIRWAGAGFGGSHVGSTPGP